LSKKIEIKVEETFKNEDEDKRIKKLEELIIRVIKKGEKVGT